MVLSAEKSALLFIVIMMDWHYYLISMKCSSMTCLGLPEVVIFHWMDSLVAYVKATYSEERGREIIPEGDLPSYSSHVFEDEIVVVGYIC